MVNNNDLNFTQVAIKKLYILFTFPPDGGVKVLSAEGWALLLVPTFLAIIVMLLYGFWDKITGMEYYVDDEILGYDEKMVNTERR